jgi:mono/diheme cytochrome c family protein
MLIAAPRHGRQGLVAVHLILFSVSPLGALAASDQATDERKGRAIVQINCATCHAVGRKATAQ